MKQARKTETRNCESC